MGKLIGPVRGHDGKTGHLCVGDCSLKRKCHEVKPGNVCTDARRFTDDKCQHVKAAARAAYDNYYDADAYDELLENYEYDVAVEEAREKRVLSRLQRQQAKLEALRPQKSHTDSTNRSSVSVCHYLLPLFLLF